MTAPPRLDADTPTVGIRDRRRGRFRVSNVAIMARRPSWVKLRRRARRCMPDTWDSYTPPEIARER